MNNQFIPSLLMLLNFMREVLRVYCVNFGWSRWALSCCCMPTIQNRIIYPNYIPLPHGFDSDLNPLVFQPTFESITLVYYPMRVVFDNFYDLKFSIHHDINMGRSIVLLEYCVLILHKFRYERHYEFGNHVIGQFAELWYLMHEL